MLQDFSSFSSYFLFSLSASSDLSALGPQHIRRSVEKQNDNIEKTITYCERPERIRKQPSRQFQIQILGEIERWKLNYVERGERITSSFYDPPCLENDLWWILCVENSLLIGIVREFISFGAQQVCKLSPSALHLNFISVFQKDSWRSCRLSFNM